MSSFGNLPKAERREGAVILHKLHSGLEFKDLSATPDCDGLCGRQQLAGDTPATVPRCHRHLTDIGALNAQLDEGAADQSVAVGGDDQRFVMRLCAQLIDPEAMK